MVRECVPAALIPVAVLLVVGFRIWLQPGRQLEGEAEYAELWAKYQELERVHMSLTSTLSSSERKSLPSAADPVHVSNASCAELGWLDDISMYWHLNLVGMSGTPNVCGQQPTVCKGQTSHSGALHYCEGLSARLCTEAELLSGEAAVNGCAYDYEQVWSSSSCPGGFKTVKVKEQATGQFGGVSVCTPAFEDAYHGRCCADVKDFAEDSLEVEVQRMRRDVHSMKQDITTASKKLAEMQLEAQPCCGDAQPLAKRTTEGKSTFVFVAGVEGTGHQFVGKIFNSCIKAGVCRTNRALQCALWDSPLAFHDKKTPQFAVKGKIHGLFATLNDTIFDDTLLQLKKMLRQEMSRDGPGKTLIINTVNDKPVTIQGREEYDGWCLSGMLAYPNLQASEFPDVHFLAAIAESLGADFRIVLLWRDSLTLMLCPTCSSEYAVYRARKITQAAHVLYGQLVRLDPAFIQCANYSDATFGYADALAAHIGVGGKGKWSLRQNLGRHWQRDAGNREMDEEVRLAINEVAIAMDLLGSVCARSATTWIPLNAS